jgi:hypothetical protein
MTLTILPFPVVPLCQYSYPESKFYFTIHYVNSHAQKINIIATSTCFKTISRKCVDVKWYE